MTEFVGAEISASREGLLMCVFQPRVRNLRFWCRVVPSVLSMRWIGAFLPDGCERWLDRNLWYAKFLERPGAFKFVRRRAVMVSVAVRSHCHPRMSSTLD